jgi:hypothetical protein
VTVAIGLVTRKRSWNNAGTVCAFPGCIQRLVVPVEEGDDEIVVGKECHIVAHGEEGPRAPATLTDAELKRWGHLIADRDGYANLILLCGIHHDVIDGDVTAYTVERLVVMKQEHEAAIAGRKKRPRLDSNQRPADQQWPICRALGLPRAKSSSSELPLVDHPFAQFEAPSGTRSAGTSRGTWIRLGGAAQPAVART